MYIAMFSNFWSDGVFFHLSLVYLVYCAHVPVKRLLAQQKEVSTLMASHNESQEKWRTTPCIFCDPHDRIGIPVCRRSITSEISDQATIHRNIHIDIPNLNRQQPRTEPFTATSTSTWNPQNHHLGCELKPAIPSKSWSIFISSSYPMIYMHTFHSYPHLHSHHLYQQSQQND